MLFPESCFPEGFHCLGTCSMTHPFIYTFCSFLLHLLYFAGENEIVPVLLEGFTVPWHGTFWENIAVAPLTAVWKHKFLGPTDRLLEHFCLTGGGKFKGKM